MKRVMLIPLFILASCAPLYGIVQGDKGKLTVTPEAVTFQNSGPDTALSPALLLRGNLSVTDARCRKMDERTIGCTLADVPVDGRAVVKYTGTVTAASITYYRPSTGNRFVYLRWP